jgi:hypothetical protein
LLDHVERATGKLVLVGDDRQLPAIDAGGAFRGLIQRGLAVELGENVRQENLWEREALDHLRAGRAAEAIELYEAHGALVLQPTAEDVRARLVSDWLAARDGGDCVMIAQRRLDVADLNERARALLKAAGAVGADEMNLPGGFFALGDQVVVKSNDRRLDISNGQRGAVLGFDVAAGTLDIACGGRRVTLDRRFLMEVRGDGEPTLVHGYAMTGHVAQGATVDRAYVLASEGMSREWAYVALSRGRVSNRLYVAAQPDSERAEFAPTSPEHRDPIERLVASLQDSEAQVLAIDSGTVLARDAIRDAEDHARRAVQELGALEQRRHRWLPGRRNELEESRELERAAVTELADVRRREAERQHGARPFVTERQIEALQDQARLRFAERLLQRDRTIGREL